MSGLKLAFFQSIHLTCWPEWVRTLMYQLPLNRSCATGQNRTDYSRLIRSVPIPILESVARRYSIILAARSMLSAIIPKTRLHLLHSSPLTTPLSWEWSIPKLFLEPHISQDPLLIISLYSSLEILYTCFNLKLS
jgi:hypothetical protein